MCRARHRQATTTNANLDCALVENALFYTASLIVKSQQDGIELLTRLGLEEAGQQWDDVSGYLYQLLAAIIRGNHTNCSQFANASRLNWLFRSGH